MISTDGIYRQKEGVGVGLDFKPVLGKGYTSFLAIHPRYFLLVHFNLAVL